MIKCAGFDTIDDANKFLNDCKRAGFKLLNATIIPDDENGRNIGLYRIARDFAGINTKYCLMWIV